MRKDNEMQEVIGSFDDLRNKYIAIGGKYAVEHEAHFSKEELYVSEDYKHFYGKHYGLYGCFTVMTQHTYGTADELLFILGVMSTHKDDMEHDTHEFYKELTKARQHAYALAEKDVLHEMKRIGAIEGLEVMADTYREAYDKYFDPGHKILDNNYFYHFKIGKALLHECEIVSGILVNDM